MIFTRGMRDKIEKYANVQNELEIEMSISGSAVYDYCCFGVDVNGKLSDDRYMIFYNQVSSPEGEICYTADSNKAMFTLLLSKLPHTIQKLVFTASIDGNGTMGEIAAHTVAVKQNKQSVIEMSFKGSDFHSEKAIISFEVYKKDGWRIAASAAGFNGGLSALLNMFGGEEITPQATGAEQQTVNPSAESVKKAEPASAVNTNPQPVKETEQVSSQKVSLKKGQKVSFSKNSQAPIIIENGWTAKGKDYDLKALVRYRNGKLIYIGAANRDELLTTPEGAVKHGGDIKRPGELEHIEIKWHPDIASVAVSSYSAIENGAGSFYQYGVFVRIKNGNQTIEIPAADTSANRRSYTLCFGEIIFGNTPDTFEVSALEMYSCPNSEKRIGYKHGKVMMDIGPKGQLK